MNFKGGRNFDRCEVKHVAFTTYLIGDGIDNRGQVVKKDDPCVTKARETPRDNTFELFGFGADLDCPKTQLEGQTLRAPKIRYESQLEANNALRRVAREVLCQTCSFSGMSETAVAVEIHNRVEARQALDAAIVEVKAIKPLDGTL